MKKGLNFVNVLGCNLPEDEIKEITGWKNYKHLESKITSFGSRMLRFLVFNENEEYGFMTLFVSPKVHTSRSGKCMYIDDFGCLSIYTDSEPENMLNPRKCLEGEASLTTMLQCLVNYDLSGDYDTWNSTMHNHGITIKNLFDNNVKGLNDFLMYHAERGYKLGIVVTSKNGYDNVETHPDLFFRQDSTGGIPSSIIKRLYSYLDPNNYNPIRGELDIKSIVDEY